MASPLVSNDLWSIIAPLLPVAPPRPRGGRPRVADRAALTGILFVLRTGIQWEMLPLEMGCGSGITCWRRLRDWQEAGVWDALHHELLRRLRAADRIDWSRACMDSASLAAKRGRRDGAEPDRSGQARHETPSGHRPERHPARLRPDERQYPRQYALRGPARLYPVDRWQNRPRATPAGQAPRRQSL